MSTKPTLLRKGSLWPADGDMDAKRLLDEWVPVEYVINWFKERKSKTGVLNRVLILKAETASGKSTTFPPELYKSMIRPGGAGSTTNNKRNIVCTQPRILTAIENVYTMLEHYGPSKDNVIKLGETIGWSTKYNKLPISKPGLLSATIGTLTQQLKVLTDDEIIAKYQYILIDETHERGLDVDMAIARLKSLLNRQSHNIDCPFVVLMSATFNPDPFINYFGVNIGNFIWCQGATARIDEFWLDPLQLVTDYTKKAAEIAEKIINEHPTDDTLQADILIFMPGAAETKSTMKWLEKTNARLAEKDPSNTFSLLKIEGEAVKEQNEDYFKTMYIPTSDQRVSINGKTFTPRRRVIITTNVAETGLTLNNLKYIIDAGYNRETEFNPVFGTKSLITKPAPQSRVRQRRGRVGRKFPGEFYALYSLEVHNQLDFIQYPTILVDDISTILLDIIIEQIKNKIDAGNVGSFYQYDLDMLDQPTPDAMRTGLEKLYTIGFISPQAIPWDKLWKSVVDGNITNVNPSLLPTGHVGVTPLGAVASLISDHSPECVRMVLGSYFWKCSTCDIITIIAWLEMKSTSFDPITKNRDDDKINWGLIYKQALPGFISSTGMIYKIRLMFGDTFIDGLMIFCACYKLLSSSNPTTAIENLTDWCKNTKVNVSACLELLKIRENIIEQFIRVGLDPFYSNSESLLYVTENSIMNVITKIKYCIYDGFRNNMLTLSSDGTYRTMNGLQVKAPVLFNEDERKIAMKAEYAFSSKVIPKTVIYDQIGLKLNKKTGIYEAVVDRISMCDGYISTERGHEFAT